LLWESPSNALQDDSYTPSLYETSYHIECRALLACFVLLLLPKTVSDSFSYEKSISSYETIYTGRVEYM
jgi:hypothetical protein